MGGRGFLSIVSMIAFAFFCLFGAMFYVDYSGMAEVPLVRPLTLWARGGAPPDNAAEKLAQAALARCKRMGNACPKAQRKHLESLTGTPQKPAVPTQLSSGRPARQLGTVVLAYGHTVRGCTKVGKAPQGAGERLVLRIDPSGAVTDTSWDGSADSRFAACVMAEAQDWLFPRASGGAAFVEVPVEVLLRQAMR